MSVAFVDSAGKEKKFTDSYTSFDKNGKIIEEKEFDRSGNFRKHETHKYNKNGDETERTEFDAAGIVIRKTVTEFNPLNDKK